MNKNKLTFIILCAGKSRRIKSNFSKILHLICGKPLIYWVIKNIRSVFLNLKIFLVINKEIENDIKKYIFNDFCKDDIFFIYQKSIYSETIGAVKSSSEIIKFYKHIIIINGDTPFLNGELLINFIFSKLSSKSLISFVTSNCEVNNFYKYGIIIRKNNNIISIKEFCDYFDFFRNSLEINVGIYFVNSKILYSFLKFFYLSKNEDKKFFTDIISYIRNRFSVFSNSISSYYINRDFSLGINNKFQLSRAFFFLKDFIIENWIKYGTFFSDPFSVFLDICVFLDKDISIYSNVIITGNSYIGKGVVIENSVVIKNSIIEDNTYIYNYTIIEDSYIGKNCKIGPFSRIKSKSDLGKNNIIGNFVELKESILQDNIKIKHFSYIGNVSIGNNCNFGAGIVICNYNGYKKYFTKIGEDVFLGSNCTLISPLNIESKSYIAAATVVNKDIFFDNFVIGRKKQKNYSNFSSLFSIKLINKF